MESNNPTYLLATLDQLRSYLTITESSFSEGTFNCSLITRSTKVAPLKFQAPELAKKLTYEWDQLKTRVNVYQTLTNLPKSEDLASAACFYYCHSLILDSVGWANFVSGKLKYRIYGTPYMREESELLDRKTVVGAAAILYGLSINEYIGSHYTAKTPEGKEHFLRGVENHCSCSRYSIEPNGFCEHSALGKVYCDNRALLVNTGLAAFF